MVAQSFVSCGLRKVNRTKELEDRKTCQEPYGKVRLNLAMIPEGLLELEGDPFKLGARLAALAEGFKLPEGIKLPERFTPSGRSSLPGVSKMCV